MSEDKSFSVALKLIDNYRFEVDFGDMGKMITDEPEPLGSGEGPNPSRLLATSVANCLAASLMFAIRKFKGDPGQVEAKVTGSMERVEGRWRIPNMSVSLQLGSKKDALPHIDRVLEQFEDFCVVTQSVRNGIDVAVTVFDASGEKLHEAS
jgi:uncharacterized OsmC-like protein